jgi:3-deoxy-7-phosphoheptulonate synthase
MTFQIIAGPCAVDTKQNTHTIAKSVKASGATVFKGGCYKPLTFPPSQRAPYQKALGKAGVQMLLATGPNLPIMAEVTEVRQLDDADVRGLNRFQIGARNQQNFELLKAVGKTHKPVMLKRHFGCSLRELWASVCYLSEYGCRDAWVCERGVVAPHQHGFRFLLDFQGVMEWKRRHPHIPIIVDVSHWMGTAWAKVHQRDVFRMTLEASEAAVAAGADGIYIDVHTDPPTALVDPYQALTLDQFKILAEELS